MIVLLARWALGDAIPPPPDDCPAGSTSHSSHAGTGCMPTPTCANALDCDGANCVHDIGLCIDEVTVCDTEDDCSRVVEFVHGTCTAGDACAVGECETANRCAQAPVEEASRDCGCSSGDGAGGIVAWSLVVALATRRRPDRARPRWSSRP